MLQIFTSGNNVPNSKKIITRDSESRKYKLSERHYIIVLANSDWSVNKLKQRRLNKLKKELDGQAITVVIDETGDRKKGKKSDYVARRYLGSVGKIDNGNVCS